MTINTGRILIVASICTLGALAVFVASFGRYSRPTRKPTLAASQQRADDLPDYIPNRTLSYKDLLTKIESERVALALRYQQAKSAKKALIISEARDVVIGSIYSEIFPAWYGTTWDFNGTTEVPRAGKIACGYFVSTVLRDAGWRVQRARLAQQASENIILSLIAEPYVKRFRRVAIGDFIKTVKEWGPGIYLVGLDIHIGFIVNKRDEVYFIHSSYVEPFAVVKERALDSKILQTSNYRVLGKITADEGLIEKWLLRKDIITRT